MLRSKGKAMQGVGRRRNCLVLRGNVKKGNGIAGDCYGREVQRAGEEMLCIAMEMHCEATRRNNFPLTGEFITNKMGGNGYDI